MLNEMSGTLSMVTHRMAALVIKTEHCLQGSEIKMQQKDKNVSNNRRNYNNMQQRQGEMQM